MTSEAKENSNTMVGDHDPMVFSGGGALGVWIECECSWISPSYYTEASARRAHAKHVEAVSS